MYGLSNQGNFIVCWTAGLAVKKENKKLCITSPFWGDYSTEQELLTQSDSKTESMAMSWCHCEIFKCHGWILQIGQDS